MEVLSWAWAWGERRKFGEDDCKLKALPVARQQAKMA